MLGARALIWTTIVALLPVAAGGDEQDWRRLMVEGKLEADLGRHEEASAAFRAVADDEAAPPSLRWEALVRLGLARSAAGDAAASAGAFRSVLLGYSEDPAAMRFLTQAVASSVPGKIWIDFKESFEELLRTARVVEVEELAPGVRPRKVTLRQGETELSAVWRPATEGEQREWTRFEVAAYEIDKLLGLDMVPPTVSRTLDGHEGSFQLWVYGCESFGAVRDRAPDTPEWRHRIFRMMTFDQVIANRARNQASILVDASWEIVLIDHSLSFWGIGTVMELPDCFDRRMVERLRQLRRPVLLARLGGLLTEQQVESLLERRDALVTHVEKLIEERGEQAVLF